MYVVLWRTVILYLLVIIVLRFMGKRQIGELQPSELVTTIMISNIAAIPIENINVPLTSGLIPIIVLASFEVLTSAITLKSRTVRKLVIGNPRIIVRDGRVIQKELKNLRMTIDDLMEQLRGASVFNIADVQFAIVETNGKLSIYQKFDARNTTNKDLNLPQPGCDSPSVIVISDGYIEEKALNYCNLDRKWLDGVLKGQGHTADQVFLMSCDRTANYQIVLKDGVR